MTDSQEILQYLVGECFFAQNHSQLASLLGQSGRMNIVRLMSNKTGDRACDRLWNELCARLNVPEELMPFLPDVWRLSNLLKSSSDALPIETSPEEHTQPKDVNDEVWQQLIALYRQDAMLYYMLVAITYAKRHTIHPYRQKYMKASEQTVRAIDERLHSLYPQQVNAHDAAEELLRTLEGIDADSWWWTGWFGGCILRLYHEPAYIDTMYEKYLFSMPFPDWQWWRDAASNHPTDTLWYWQKNDGMDGVYDVMCVEEGQDAAHATHFQLVFVGKEILRLIQYEGGTTRSTYIRWQMEHKEDIYSLRFSAAADNDLSRLLPQELIMLVITDDQTLVARAQGMTEAMQHETFMRIYREMGLEPTDEYTIEDIECSCRTVKILYQQTGTKKIQTATVALTKYPALRSVTVHAEVELYKGNNDNRLYALWNSIGILVPLPS